MSASAISDPCHDGEGFRHQALFYEGDAGFLAGTLAFIREGVAVGEPVLVAVSPARIDMLRARLDGDAERVKFTDMADVGANPARIIPAWRDFVDEYAGDGRRIRGIGEPIWAGRRPAELVECQHHESLLNLEFADKSPLWLMCPYDTKALDRSVIDEARRSHPLLRHGRVERASAVYRDESMFAAPLEDPLPEPPDTVARFEFEGGPLDPVRRFVSRHAKDFGLSGVQTVDLVLAVNEVATNSVIHGGGRGLLRVWETDDALVFELSDGGRIDRPLIGRERPAADCESGRGLWLANQLCDLVQVRSSLSSGTVVRLHTWRS